MPAQRYPNRVSLVQTGQKVFAITNLRKRETEKKDYLMRQLRKYAPVKSGRLQGSYQVWALEPTPNRWALIITNRAPYFKFVWHYYRGELVTSKGFKRDFVKQAVDDFYNKEIKGAPAPKLPIKKKPLFPLLPLKPKKKKDDAK